MPSRALIDELILLAQEEWHSSLSVDEATALAKWLILVYSALLKE